MKHLENKLSYAVTFELHPECEGDEEAFAKRLASAVEKYLEGDPELVFIDAETTPTVTPGVQINLLVADLEEALESLKAFVDGPFRFLPGAKGVSRVIDSKGHRF
jgi:hypothetical protein